MTQRSRNRLNEHGHHGWKVVDARNHVVGLASPGVLLQCPCDWAGWIPLADAKELAIVPKCFEPKS